MSKPAAVKQPIFKIESRQYHAKMRFKSLMSHVGDMSKNGYQSDPDHFKELIEVQKLAFTK